MRILIIEDEPGILNFLRQGLEEESYSVDTATNEVILISKDLSADRTAEVHCHFRKYEPDLLPGTFMNAELALESRNAIILPDDAIVSFEGKEYIFIPGKDGFIMTAVQTGNSENGVTEILSPELRGTRCVTKDAYSLLMFLKNRAEE